MSNKIHDEPSKVAAEEGVVIVDGPDGVAVTLTAEAALETADRLADNAAEAAGQRRLDKISKPHAERYDVKNAD